MHSMNTLQLLWELRYARVYTMHMADMGYVFSWGALYVVFEWWFVHHIGYWHYPLLDYTRPFCSLMYVGLFGVLAAAGKAGCTLCTSQGMGKKPPCKLQ